MKMIRVTEYIGKHRDEVRAFQKRNQKENTKREIFIEQDIVGPNKLFLT